MNNPHLSIIIPAYNEAARIGVTLESLRQYFEKVTMDIEVIVVNDGSADETAIVVMKHRERMPYLSCITIPVNRGKGHAVRTGMQQARGRYRLFMDADNSVDIAHLPAFLESAETGTDVVIGSIALEQASAHERGGSYRRLLGLVARRIIHLFTFVSAHDTQRGFKLFTARAADAIFTRQTIERFGFDIELLVIAQTQGFSVRELPVIWDNPDGSTITCMDYVRTLVELARIVVNRSLHMYGGRSREDKNLVHFTPAERAEHGRGFHYRGKKYVHHSDLHHSETALYTFMHSQLMLLATVLALLALAFVFNWHLTLIVLFSVLTIFYFIDLLFNAFLIYRSFTATPEITATTEELAALTDAELPIYTVFCPLYKEWQVVPQFVAAMNAMEYPKEKLQIMFLLEENDQETVEKVQSANLPSHFEIVVVPHSLPKTKPKAMNYGLEHVRGEYLVIYDAEDVPETDQLKKAVLAFRQLPLSTVCVQAKLNFYNPVQNVLTRLFTAEYSLWFDLVLPGLQSVNAPIPLGGTSNNFRIAALRELSGWDAFNVTEDCDLGMRLAKRGYRTAIIESTTYEEANSKHLNWFNQRSRWIKGYMQTYLVHMRRPSLFVSKRALLDLLTFQVTVGGKILSMFINPLMWAITIVYFAFRAHTAVFIESLFPGPILYIGVFSFVFGNFMYMYYYMIACAKRGYYNLIPFAFLVPLYWLAMSVAAWRAAYEVVVKPHYWAKTVHGLHLQKRETISNERLVPEITA